MTKPTQPLRPYSERGATRFQLARRAALALTARERGVLLNVGRRLLERRAYGRIVCSRRLWRVK